MKNVHDFLNDPTRIIRCVARIILPGTKGHAETYCQLALGHQGEHSTGEVTANPSPAPSRCPSLWKTIQCGLPKGHYGNHWNQTALRSWESSKEPKV